MILIRRLKLSYQFIILFIYLMCCATCVGVYLRSDAHDKQEEAEAGEGHGGKSVKRQQHLMCAAFKQQW